MVSLERKDSPLFEVSSPSNFKTRYSPQESLFSVMVKSPLSSFLSSLQYLNFPFFLNSNCRVSHWLLGVICPVPEIPPTDSNHSQSPIIFSDSGVGRSTSWQEKKRTKLNTSKIDFFIIVIRLWYYSILLYRI